VIVVDNDTTDPAALAAFAAHPIRVVPFPGTFNFSRANNLGVANAQGELLLFLNNDTEVLEADWLDRMALYFEDPEVGAVGAQLLYPDRTVQHAGVVMGARGTADHVMRHFGETWDGYGGSLTCARETTAATAACLMVRRDAFEAVGAFSEDFAKHYQDVDLCLKLREAGYSIVTAALPRLIHHESLSRKADGYDLGDRAILIDRWHGEIARGDRFYNRNLDVQALDYSLA
jgi:GT2 family glycosyltransferase